VCEEEEFPKGVKKDQFKVGQVLGVKDALYEGGLGLEIIGVS